MKYPVADPAQHDQVFKVLATETFISAVMNVKLDISSVAHLDTCTRRSGDAAFAFLAILL